MAREIKWRAKDGDHVVKLHMQAPELLHLARALQVHRGLYSASISMQTPDPSGQHLTYFE